MENLNINATVKTPGITMDAQQGILKIWGKSIPENSIDFYKPVYQFIDDYVSQPVATTKIIIQLEYFNTSSSKCLLDIFRKFEPLQTSGKSQVMVEWMYEEEDEDMMEAGDDYQTIVKLPFSILKIN